MSTLKKVLFVGWDSADWRVINPLLDAGKLPNLKQLIDGGVSGNMATLNPILSPMLWTSIATGKRPHKHGIHGFTEPDPHGDGVRPITNLSRKTKAIWNILSQNDKKCIVVGWWPSHPAEPLPNGVMVSNAFQRAPNNDVTRPWPMAIGTVHPASMAETLAQKRKRASELDGSCIVRFLPNARNIDEEKDSRPKILATTIADCANIHSASMYLINNEPWDFMVVYYDAIDHFGHGFMRYHPPRQKWITKKDYDLYSGVIEASYCYHDLMLGELLSAAGSDTTVLLMSDHGFHPDNLRPAAIPIEPAGPAVEHRHYGIFVLKGPKIKIGERVHGATVLDLCPTLLSLFDLPVGHDMDGKPLVGAWKDQPKIESIPSWDNVPGPDGTHPPGTYLKLDESREAFRHLEELGYIEPLSEDARQRVDKAERELRYNLACSYIDAQMPSTAADIFVALWKECPDEHRHGAKLFTCLLSLDRYIEARETFEQLRINRRKFSREAAKQLKNRREEWKSRKPEDFKVPERKELDRLASRAKLSPAPMQQMEAMLLMAEGKSEKALPLLKKLKVMNHKQPEVHILLARAHGALKQWKKAENEYMEALKLDSDNAYAHAGLAQVCLEVRRNYEAADFALTAIDLLYHHPFPHFLLGVALHRLGKIDHALEALHVSLMQNANFLPAHRRLAYIYKVRLKDFTRAAAHREKYREGMVRLRTQRTAPLMNSGKFSLIRDVLPVEVESMRLSEAAKKEEFDPSSLYPARADASFATIVSGLPRSGTSLMMQVLAAGGLPPLYDNHRLPDVDNPRGYVEFAPAKGIRTDHSWMSYAEGRALKLVAQLLPFLPIGYNYRIIFMERSLDEVIASQRLMLDRRGREGAALTREQLRTTYQEQLRRVTEVLESRKLPVLRVSHQEAIRNPAALATSVASFLGLSLDRAAMSAAIDPTLHRQRSLN